MNFKKLGYELNHILTNNKGNSVIPLATLAVDDVSTLTLFEKSLALTSDLKRLPILRSMQINIDAVATFFTAMAASGVGGVNVMVSVYDGIVDIDHLIASCSLYALIQANTGVLKPGNFVWPFCGGYLLHDKIIIKMTTTLNQNAAGAAFPINQVAAIVNLEIDWAEVSMNDFKDYILENVYGEQ